MTLKPHPAIHQLQVWKDQFQWDTARADGRLERTCVHGVGHPVAHIRGYLFEIDSIHGCDGCCHDWPHMAVHPNPSRPATHPF